MKLMENEGGKIDKWMISNLMTRMIIWTNVIFLKFIFYDIYFAKAPTGPSYVDMDQNNSNKDDLTMLCEHGDIEGNVVRVQVGNVTG